MKIAFVTSHINKSLQWKWFSEELHGHGIFHIHIVINSFPPALLSDIQNIGVPIYYLKHKNFFSHFINLWKVIRILKKNKINIVHSELPFGNLIAQLACFTLRIRSTITTCENTTWAKDYNSVKQKLIDRITYKLSSKIVVLTPSSKDFIRHQYKIQENKFVFIPHALKIKEYEYISPERIAALKKELLITENDFIIGMVARLEKWKGHEFAIRAMRDVIQLYPYVKLLIFGSKGDSYESTRQLIDACQLQSHVLYKGSINDNVALYKLFDIHLHIPINEEVETFGITVIEGMIAECPQILTLSGIATMTSKHMENCYIVDYCSASAVKQAIIDLIQKKGLREEIALNAKRYAIEHFNYSRKVNAHLELYKELFHDKKTSKKSFGFSHQAKFIF